MRRNDPRIPFPPAHSTPILVYLRIGIFASSTITVAWNGHILKSSLKTFLIWRNYVSGCHYPIKPSAQRHWVKLPLAGQIQAHTHGCILKRTIAIMMIIILHGARNILDFSLSIPMRSGYGNTCHYTTIHQVAKLHQQSWFHQVYQWIHNFSMATQYHSFQK